MNGWVDAYFVRTKVILYLQSVSASLGKVTVIDVVSKISCDILLYSSSVAVI